MNCVKIGRECPGFPNRLNLLFKHETVSVTKKAVRGKNVANRNRASAKQLAAGLDRLQHASDDAFNSRLLLGESSAQRTSREGHDEDPNDDLHRSWKAALDSLPSLATRPNEDRTPDFFFTDFVPWPFDEETARGFWDSVILTFETRDNRSALYLVTEAIALRAMTSFPENSSLAQCAEKLHDRAVQAGESALEPPDLVKTDEMRMSSWLFSLYECVASSNLKDVDTIEREDVANDSASARTDPSSEAKSRNPSYQFQNSARMRMVLAKAKQLLDHESIRTPNSIWEVNRVLHETYDLQNELFQWDMNMPPHFGYRSTSNTSSLLEKDATSPPEAWPPSIHFYNNVHTASIRNNNRVSQLLCSNVVVQALKWLDPEGFSADGRFKAAVYRIQYLVNDIAASVPFHLGVRNESEVPPTRRKRQPEASKYMQRPGNHDTPHSKYFRC